jgi:predicted transcriptional regulator
MAKRKDQKEFRVYLPADAYRLLQSLAAIRDSSVNALVNEAIEQWLVSDEQQKTIDKHRLNEIDELE